MIGSFMIEVYFLMNKKGSTYMNILHIKHLHFDIHIFTYYLFLHLSIYYFILDSWKTG